jgi:quercetin dioxygenase-like cupin family protein
MSIVNNMKISNSQTDRTSSDGVLTEMALGPGDAPELTFGKFVIEPGVSLPAHAHAADTIAYCVSGSCSFRVGEELNEEFEIGPGEYCYIPAGMVHTEETGEHGVELIFARDRQGGATS